MRPSAPQGGPGGPRRPRGRFQSRRKVCAFCADKNRTIDYKEPSGLRRYVSERARMEPRRKTGVCARHQRLLSTAIKRARHLGMLPYVVGHKAASRP